RCRRGLDGLERVQECPAAEKQRRGHACVSVDLRQELERLAAGGGVEREPVQREVRALGQPRERLADRRGLGVVADEDRAHLLSLPAPRYQASRPPSTVYEAPVTNEASSEARNATTAATSSGRPMRPIGCAPTTSRSASAGSSWLSTYTRICSVSMNPGATQLTRTPSPA